MSGEPGSIEYVEYYRERALLARIEAAKTKNEEVKAELLRIAAAFDLLAAHKQQQDTPSHK